MCLNLLNDLNRTALPVDLTRDDEIDRGLLLRSAGLVAGLVVKPADGDAPRLLRVLAITARGKRVLRDARRIPVEDIP